MSLKTLNLDEYRPVEDAIRNWMKRSPAVFDHKMRKLEALIAAGWKCVACGAEDDLTIHHLTRTKGKRDKREVRCVDCHLAAHRHQTPEMEAA